MSTDKRISLRTILPIIILAAAVILFMTLLKSKPTPETAPPTIKVWQVHSQTLTKGQYNPNVILYGKVESPQSTEIKSAISADVEKTYVREGNQVHNEQLLMQLDDRDAKLVVKQREAEVQELQSLINTEKTRFQSDQTSLEHEQALVQLREKNLQREQQLLKTNASSEANVDKAKEALRQQQLTYAKQLLSVKDHQNRLLQLQARLAKAQVLQQKAELDLTRTKITAPFAGKITSVYAVRGNHVRVGDPLFTMYDSHDLELRIHIPSTYMPIINQSMEKNTKIQANASIYGKPVTLELSRLSAQVARGRGGVDGLFKVISGKAPQELGRTLEITIDLPQVNDAYLIPNSALYGNNKIYIDNDGKMKSITITRVGSITSTTGKTQVLIQSDELTPGDTIITTHLPNAIDGLAVNTIPAQEATANAR